VFTDDAKRNALDQTVVNLPEKAGSGNIRAECGKSGLSRRPGLVYKQTAITADLVMSNRMNGGTQSWQTKQKTAGNRPLAFPGISQKRT
jgi:hypothetical protein